MEEGVWQWHHLRDTETEIRVVCESRQGQRQGFWGEGVGTNGTLNWPEPMQICINSLETDNQILWHLRLVFIWIFGSLLTEPPQFRIRFCYKDGVQAVKGTAAYSDHQISRLALWPPYQYLHQMTTCPRKMSLLLFLNFIAVMYISRNHLDRSAGGLLCLSH